MTHEEAFSLLPAYALGALDEDLEDLEAHLRHCSRCKAQLSLFLETTTALGEAAETVTPPPALRGRVLSSVPVQPVAPRGRLQRLVEMFAAPTWKAAPIALALLIVLAGLTAWIVVQQQQLQATRSELVLDERGLALLTSTETVTERLAPIAEPTSQAHGHWYHRPGVNTQVLVVEFMPAPPRGESYYGWLRLADGSWRAAGPFSLNSGGYGRLILLGSDGSDVRGVTVTSQPEATAQPSGEVVLRWPGP